MGSSVSLWVRPLLHWASYSRVSSRSTATAAVLPAVSKANKFIEITYLSFNRNLPRRLIHTLNVDFDGIFQRQQLGAVLAPLAGDHGSHVEVVIDPGGGQGRRRSCPRPGPR